MLIKGRSAGDTKDAILPQSQGSEPAHHNRMLKYFQLSYQDVITIILYCIYRYRSAMRVVIWEVVW